MKIPYASPNLRVSDFLTSLLMSGQAAENRIKSYFSRITGKKYILITNSCCSALFLAYRANKAMTQELIPDDGTNKTISFAAFCVTGEIKAYWMGEKLREHPVRFGTATFARSMHAEPCLTQSKKLLKALNYTGVCEVEYLKDSGDGQYKLIEINARTWLWVGLANACGVNFPLYIYNHAHNIKTTYPFVYEKDLCWRNFWTDTIYSMKYIIKGQLRFSTYRESLRSKMVYAVKSKSDPAPFRKMLTLLFLRWRSR
jgi:predicted ATP-grasp superfamily ATP-dependent carboligase